MRLMDAELGDGRSNSVASTVVANTPTSPSVASTTTPTSVAPTSTAATSVATSVAPAMSRTPPLPLPDAGALDWATLVHTATRAMLQVG